MISKYSVKRPYTVLVAVVLVIVLGAVSLSKNDDRSASGYEFSVCAGYHNRYGSKSGTGGK